MTTHGDGLPGGYRMLHGSRSLQYGRGKALQLETAVHASIPVLGRALAGGWGGLCCLASNMRE
jgi:hypothetical protein